MADSKKPQTYSLTELSLTKEIEFFQEEAAKYQPGDRAYEAFLELAAESEEQLAKRSN
jgi:hypothetical protein